MDSARRTVIIAKNDDKRIIRYNHLPQKRRLLEVVEERKIKWTKLNKDLRIQMNEYSNEYLFTTNAFWSVLSILKKLKFPQKFCHSLVRVKSCPHVNRTRTRHRTPHRTLPAPAQRGLENTTKMLHFWMLNIGEKCGSNRLELWVWNVKLSLFQVRTDVKKQVLTKLDAFRVFWQHLKCYIWKWHIGQFLNSATKKLYKFFLLNERACPPRGGLELCSPVQL